MVGRYGILECYFVYVCACVSACVCVCVCVCLCVRRGIILTVVFLY